MTHDIFNVADRGEFALSAIDALKELLRHALASGDDLATYADGINFLFEPHIAAIDEANRALRSHMETARAAAAAGSAESEKVHGLRRELIAGAVGNGAQAGEIAAALNMRRASVDRVIAQLKGDAGAEAEPRRMAV